MLNVDFGIFTNSGVYSVHWKSVKIGQVGECIITDCECSENKLYLISPSLADFPINVNVFLPMYEIRKSSRSSSPVPNLLCI